MRDCKFSASKIVLIQNFKIWMPFILSIFTLRFVYPDIVAKHGEKFTENMNRNEFLLLCYVLRCRMCSGVVTLSVYTTPGKLKNQPDHGGNRTRDLWFASPMLYQLSYYNKNSYHIRNILISKELD